MSIEEISELFNKYNPISRYAIKPALKLADAHNHPIKGGIAAAIASGLAHCGLAEIIGQTSDYFFGTNFRDPQTKIFLTNPPNLFHLWVCINMFSNVIYGVAKYCSERKGSSNP